MVAGLCLRNVVELVVGEIVPAGGELIAFVVDFGAFGGDGEAICPGDAVAALLAVFGCDQVFV